MAARYRRRRFRPSCGSVLFALAVAAGAAWVVVRSITLWVTTHPGALLVVAVLGCLGATGITRAARPVAGRPAGTVQEFTSLDPAEFEQAVAGLCWRDGCRDVRVVGGAGDLGADVLATTPDGRRLLLQCKRYAPGRNVGSPEVQRVGGTYAVVHHADLALVVTTGGYTDAARDYAHQAGIRLIDSAGLDAWARGGRPPWA